MVVLPAMLVKAFKRTANRAKNEKICRSIVMGKIPLPVFLPVNLERLPGAYFIAGNLVPTANLLSR
jgi:hypothetical protein